MTVFARKACRTCGIEKVLCRQFYRHPTCRDGYMHICKACHRREVLENKALKREHYNALGRRHYARRVDARRRYLAQPHVRERIRKYKRDVYRIDKALEARA